MAKEIDFAQNNILCGCVDDELEADLKLILLRYLEANLKSEAVYYREFNDGQNWLPKYTEALLTILDNAGLIEHGTAIRGSWITEKGRFIAEGGDIFNDPSGGKFSGEANG